MKRKDITTLTAKTTAELQQQLQELASELAKTRMRLKVGKQTNTKLATILRDDIARVKTVLRQQELAQPAEPQTKA